MTNGSEPGLFAADSGLAACHDGRPGTISNSRHPGAHRLRLSNDRIRISPPLSPTPADNSHGLGQAWNVPRLTTWSPTIGPASPCPLHPAPPSELALGVSRHDGVGRATASGQRRSTGGAGLRRKNAGRYRKGGSRKRNVGADERNRVGRRRVMGGQHGLRVGRPRG
jgi:hypothetical protein